MSNSLGLLPSLAVTLAIAATIASGCQAAPPATSSPLSKTIQTLAGPTTRVTADLSALFGKHGHRKLEGGFFASAPIANVRLRARGKLITGELSASVVFTVDAQGHSTSPATVSLVVPSGPNRLFTLEGLDAAGNVVATMRTIATLSPGAAQTLIINANTDAAGRVFADIMAGPGPGDALDTQNADAQLAVGDQVVPLLAYVSLLTGFDAVNNTYSGVPPVYFRDHVLADLLRTNGYGLLANAAPVSLKSNAGAAVAVTLTKGGVAMANTPITVYDPLSTSVMTDVNGLAQFANIPPGTWTVAATLTGGLTALGTVTVRDTEAGLTVVLAASAPVALPATPPGNGGTGIGVLVTVPAPAIALAPDLVPTPPLGGTPFVTTIAGGKPGLISNVVPFTNNMGTAPTVVGSAPSKIVFDGAGNGYTLAYDQIWMLPPSGGFKRLAWSAPYDSSGVITGTSLKTLTVTSAGVVYVLDNTNKLYKVTGPGSVTNIPVIALAAPKDMVAAPDGNLYITDNATLVRVNLLTLAATPFTTGIPAGAIATDAMSNLYIVRTDSNEVWKYPAFSAAPMAVVYSTTDAASADSAVSLQGAKQIVADNAMPPKLYVADTGNNRIRVISPNGAGGTMTTLAGLEIGLSNATAGALFNRPMGVAFNGNDAANPYLVVADSFNGQLRKLNLSDNTTTTIMALQDPQFAEGTGSNARFGELGSVTVTPSGNRVVLDRLNNVLMLIGAGNDTSRVAGTGQGGATISGPNLTSSLGDSPLQVVSGTASNLYALVSGNKIVSIGNVIAPLALTIAPTLIASDRAGNLYAVTDQVTSMSLYTLTPGGATTLVMAGLPSGMKSFAVDPNSGSPTYYLGYANNVQKVTTTGPAALAGFVGGATTPADGIGGLAGFSAINGLCIDETAHVLFVADLNRVRGVDLSTARVSTFAGIGGTADRDGAAASAQFGTLSSIAIGVGGDLLLTESDRVRRIQR